MKASTISTLGEERPDARTHFRGNGSLGKIRQRTYAAPTAVSILFAQRRRCRGRRRPLETFAVRRPNAFDTIDEPFDAPEPSTSRHVVVACPFGPGDRMCSSMTSLSIRSIVNCGRFRIGLARRSKGLGWRAFLFAESAEFSFQSRVAAPVYAIELMS